MTMLSDRPNTALLVIDVQQGVIGDAHDAGRVVDNIGTLVDRADDARTPVIWVQHSDDELTRGSDAWQWVPELSPAADAPVVDKHYGDPFEATVLEAVLSGLGIGHVVVTGAHSDACVRSTLHGAFVRGYDVTLVSDGHTTADLTEWGAPSPDLVVSHTNLCWQFQRGPGRVAAVCPASDIAF